MTATPKDIAAAIQADSDQLTADDLRSKPMTGRIARVKTRRVQKKGDQPVDIWLQGHDLPWRPCKTMVRLLDKLWGRDPRPWVGRSVRLYCDPSVRDPSGATVGGIRLSHASHIDGTQRISLPVARGRRKVWPVQPLAVAPPSLEAVLQGHGHTLAVLDAARLAAGRPAVADLTDEQRAQLATRYLSRQRLERDLQAKAPA